MSVYVLMCRPIQSRFFDHEDEIEAIYSTSDLAMKGYRICVDDQGSNFSYWIVEYNLDRESEQDGE